MRALELGREAEPLAKALDDPRREASAHCLVSVALSMMGRSAEAIEHGERTMALAEALQEPALLIAARYSLGLPHWYLGAFRAAIDFLQRDAGLTPEHILERLVKPRGDGTFQEAFTKINYSFSQTAAAACFAEVGEFDQAMLHAEWAVELTRALEIQALRAFAEATLGFVELRKGDLQKALHLAQLDAQSRLANPTLRQEVLVICSASNGARASCSRLCTTSVMDA